MTDKVFGVFDYINDISYDKKNIFNKENANEYNIYLTNKAFSYHVDTIFIANRINEYPFISKKMHYDYLYNSIRSRRRFADWNKYEEDEDLELIKNYYNYNTHRAKEALRLLTKEDLKEIKNYLDTGGIY